MCKRNFIAIAVDQVFRAFFVRCAGHCVRVFGSSDGRVTEIWGTPRAQVLDVLATNVGS
jgi:hypothetical protein